MSGRVIMRALTTSPTLITKPMTSGCVLKTRLTFTYVFAVAIGRGSVWALEWHSTAGGARAVNHRTRSPARRGGAAAARDRGLPPGHVRSCVC